MAQTPEDRCDADDPKAGGIGPEKTWILGQIDGGIEPPLKWQPPFQDAVGVEQDQKNPANDACLGTTARHTGKVIVRACQIL